MIPVHIQKSAGNSINLCLFQVQGNLYMLLLVPLLFSSWVVSDPLWPCELQQARLSCPPLSPRVSSDSCPLSQQCYPTISPSVTPFSSYPQSFASSGSLPVSRLFISGGQSIRALASALVLPKNVKGWFPLGLTGLISFQSWGPYSFLNAGRNIFRS